MESITNESLKLNVKEIKLSKIAKLKADGDSEEQKTFTIVIDFNGSNLEAVFEKAVSSAVIQWQNTNRKNYTSLSDKSTIVVPFKSPGRVQVDPKQALLNQAKAQGVDVTDKKALQAFIMEQIENM